MPPTGLADGFGRKGVSPYGACGINPDGTDRHSAITDCTDSPQGNLGPRLRCRPDRGGYADSAGVSVPTVATASAEHTRKTVHKIPPIVT